MRLDARAVLPWLVAALLLGVVLSQTLNALRQSGMWTAKPRVPAIAPEDPYAGLEAMLARSHPPLPAAGLRNPFAFGGTPTPIAVRQVKPRIVVPPVPPRPVLTSIIWDNDPRATVRWNDREYPVRPNSLFAEFRVTNITRDAVVLERGGETLVLRLPRKGEQP